MSTSVTYREDELVQLLRQKTERAFEYLYQNYSNALYTVALQVVPDEEFAKDILQKAFIKIWSNIDNYQAEKGRLFTWMMNITRNTAIDFTRSKIGKEGSRNYFQEEFVDNSEKHSSGTFTDSIGLSRYMLRLPDDMKKVIHLVYLRGHTHEEVSAMLGMPLGTVKTKIRNGLSRLKEMMSE